MAITARTWLFVATAGLALGILGFVWDIIWHRRHGGMDMTGVREVLEAHSLMLVGVAIIVVALARVVPIVPRPRTAVLGTRAAFAGSISMAVGFAWDSVRHVQGTESATAHSMIYAGLHHRRGRTRRRVGGDSNRREFSVARSRLTFMARGVAANAKLDQLVQKMDCATGDAGPGTSRLVGRPRRNARHAVCIPLARLCGVELVR